MKKLLALAIGMLWLGVSAGMADIGGSSVTTITPDPLTEGTYDLCVTFYGITPDYEYLDYISVDLPDGWTVNSQETDSTPPHNGDSGALSYGVDSGNIVWWATNGYTGTPTGYGAWNGGSAGTSYTICCNVTGDCTGAPYNWNWTLLGDGYGGDPHSVTGTYGPLSCQASGYDCSDAPILDCSSGTVHGNNGSGIPGVNNWSAYPNTDCAAWDESGPENVYQVQNLTWEDQAVRLVLNTAAELDLFAGGCGADQMQVCDDGGFYLLLEDGYYFNLAVDGRNGATGDYDLQVGCDTLCEALGYSIYCSQRIPDMTTDLGRPSYWDYYDNDGTAPEEVGWTDGEEVVFFYDNPTAGATFTASLSNLLPGLDLDLIVMFDYCDNDWGYIGWGEDSYTVSSAAAGRYFFIVDSYAGQEGPFDITLTCGNPQLDCSGAPTLPCNGTLTGTTVGGNADVNHYTCSQWDESGPERVAVFTLGSTTDVTVILSPDNVDQDDLDLFVLTDCDEETCIGGATSSYAVETLQGSLDPGTYYAVVDGYAGDSGPYHLTLYCGPTPTPTPTATPTPAPTPELNLDCSNPVPMTCEQYYFGNTAAFGQSRAIHYSCDPGRDEDGPEEMVYVNLTESQPFSVEMWPAAGVELDLFLLTTCNRNACFAASLNPSDQMESISEILPPGDYYIVVDGPGAGGAYTLTYTCPPPHLDCTGAAVLPCDGSVTGNTATGESEVSEYRCSNPPLEETGPELVYVIYAAPGDLTLTLTPTNGDDLDLYLLGSCDQEDCLDFSSVGQGAVETIFRTLTSTETFYVVVEGYRGESGAFTLAASCAGAPSPTPTATPTITPTPTEAPPPVPASGAGAMAALLLVLTGLFLLSTGKTRRGR